MTQTNQLLAALFCLICYNLTAQTNGKDRIVELLNKSQNYYESLDNYSMESSFKLYVSHTSNEIKEHYNGITLKKGKTVYSKIATTELINLNGMFLKIDNLNKRIKISKIPQQIAQQLMPSSIKSIMGYFTNFSVTDLKDQWKCTMSVQKISLLPYGKVVFYISKTSRQLLKQELYFFTQYKTKLVKGVPRYDMPRLEINFNNIKTTGYQTAGYFDLENYLRSSKGKFYPANKYKSYTIVD